MRTPVGVVKRLPDGVEVERLIDSDSARVLTLFAP